MVRMLLNVSLCSVLALLRPAFAASNNYHQAQPGQVDADNVTIQGEQPSSVQASESVFGAGCRWDPTTSNIEQVSYTFRTGHAPPSTWYTDVSVAGEDYPGQLHRRDAPPSTPPAPALAPPGSVATPAEVSNVAALDGSYHTGLIDVLTFRARSGAFGSSLNSAGCALPAFSERLAQLEEEEQAIVNNFTQTQPNSRTNPPSAMFFWAGLSNYDPRVRSDLIQTVVFYGDGCAANPRQGLCVYAAEYSNFRYSKEDHMCMGSNMPIFYPVNEEMTVVYRTQAGFRTQESWIDGKMVSYLRSAGDQVMNSFVITQECKGCTWPETEQIYSNITLNFSEVEEDFDKLGLCTGGAEVQGRVRKQDGGKTWVIDKVRVPAGMHVTSTPAAAGGSGDGAVATDRSGKSAAVRVAEGGEGVGTEPAAFSAKNAGRGRRRR